ncbi:uncharacterized protein L203_104340 [Cryptococcus depauperatus CBS 7841]|uniref:Zinc-ribbon 15 domain-containing protein n=1 Tax=Cryptococcus depauperatus CBS 7841 TaxID=1295531 RepID=A0AAJ8JVE6_9TREE
MLRRRLFTGLELCIPLVCGFPEKFKQDEPAPGRMCPRCYNAAVVGGSTRTWFEFFWIPLIPFTKHHIWLCSICHWQMRKGEGPDPQPPNSLNQRPPDLAAHDPRPPPPTMHSGYGFNEHAQPNRRE